MMYKIIFCTLIGIGLSSNQYLKAQAQELESFRTVLTRFVSFDQGKEAGRMKTSADSIKLRDSMETAFIAFTKKAGPQVLDDLKKTAKTDGKNSYWYDNYMYSFYSMRKNPMNKNPENNTSFRIMFYGLYDYQLSNFVSVIIQPFKIGQENLIISYYKLNGQGTYFIKNEKSDDIIYRGQAFTSESAIDGIFALDKTHMLIIENMGDDGQRAHVLKTNPTKWEQIKAFQGKAFEGNCKDYTQLKAVTKRVYLRLASTKTIASHQRFMYLSEFGLLYDPETKTISYKTSEKGETQNKATWKEGVFMIDDYFLGNHLMNDPLPFPG